MLRMRNLCSVAVALGLAISCSAVLNAAQAQGMPMGTMKTTKDSQGKAGVPDASTPTYGPNQAMAPGTPERVTPTYRDTTEDRIMRELTDDGAHDRSDTQR